MRTDIDPLLEQAALAPNRTPLLRVWLYSPTLSSQRLDLSPYVVSFTLTLPPNQKPGIVQLTCVNPQGVISRSPVFSADYELLVALGYLTPAGPRFAPIGRFWLDTPQHTLSTAPPKDEVVIQARDTVKLLMERTFTDKEQFTIENVTVRQALQIALSHVTVGGQPIPVVFDDDPGTRAALDMPAVTRTAGPQTPAPSVMALVKDLLATSKLLLYPRWDGGVTIGLKNQQSPVVMTFGATGRDRRPVFVRDMKKMSLNTKNWVHVWGTGVIADAYDQANITRIGRVKWALINDPTIVDVETAQRRARQELDLQSRLEVQPDFTAPWIFSLERRDLIAIDDERASGIPRGVYRIEDIQYNYQSGQNPKAEMQLGLGKAYAEELVLDSSALYEAGGTDITSDGSG